TFTALAAAKRAVTLSWPGSIGDNGTAGGGTSGIAGYDVWRAPAGGPPTRLASTTALSYTDGSRAQGTTYDYYVKTYDGAGNRSAGVKTAKAL
ncbi:MAG: hypothetical protein QOE13_3376, partial [Gaiellaceae bacterium]|nr:hypothetical protein [Gaiellaceae bacterium]